MISAKRIRKLRTAHGRKKEGAFLVETHKLVADALGSGWKPDVLICPRGRQKEFSERLTQDLSRFSGLDSEGVLSELLWQEWEEKEFLELSQMDHPDGLFAVFRGRLAENWSETGETFPDGENRIKSSCKKALPDPKILLLDGLQDPGNVGTVLRSAEAFGVHTVMSWNTVDYENMKVLRASMGACFRLRLVEGKAEEILPDLKRRGYCLLGADMEGTPLFQYDFSSPAMLVIGNEGNGLSTYVREQVDRVLSIPMEGAGESLNAAASAVVFLYEWNRPSGRGK